MESSLVARGDLWRVEASHGRTAAGNDNSSLFLLQLGPVLFVRDSTLLLPVHLSKQHLLWYGYDRKVISTLLANGIKLYLVLDFGLRSHDRINVQMQKYDFFFSIKQTVEFCCCC